MLREYIVPETSKEDFQRRLRDVLEDRQDATASNTGAPQTQTQSPQPQTPIATSTGAAAAPAPAPASTESSTPAPVHAPAPAPATNPPSSSSQSATQSTETRSQSGQPQSDNIRLGERNFNVARTNNAQKSTAKPAQRKPEQKPEQKSEKKPEKPEQKPQKPQTGRKEVKPIPKPSGPSTTDQSDQKPKPPRGPPKEYRLQVRLFDGSSVRSSFLPSHTIRANVRPWLDGQMAEEKRPYNLKHIMTPLPNRTLSVADEERSLEALNLGPTANLVMIPINTYTEAYSSSASLPVRAVSTVYGLVSSTVGAATGLVGSFLGYGQTAPAPSPTGTDPSTLSQTGSSAAGSRPTPPAGPRIRTLQDQRDEEGDKQFYNGNQVRASPKHYHRWHPLTCFSDVAEF